MQYAHRVRIYSLCFFIAAALCGQPELEEPPGKTVMLERS